jgi:Lamin Tail Domain/Fn3 associated
VIVSEFQASNKSTLADEDQEYKDWIEILNATASPVLLDGWRLTDKPTGDANDLNKWVFPNNVVLAPGQTLLIWASDKNRKVAGQPLHTNFQLDATNEGVGIVNAQGVVVDSHTWASTQPEDRSAGWGIDNFVGAADGRVRKLRYFGLPTPGTLNTEPAYENFCNPPVFSSAGGIFEGTSSSLTITAPAAVTVRYTTDFSVPTAASAIVNNPINITPNTIIRAVAMANNCLPSPVVTRSFLFKQKVLGTAVQGVQPTDHQVKPAAYPDATSEGSYKIDYAMDPVRIAADKNSLVTQLSAIPSVSLVLPNNQFFNVNTGGIYANASISESVADPQGTGWKRVSSIEYIDPSTGAREQETGEVSIAGGASIRPSTTAKHNFKIEFTKKVSSNAEGVWNFALPPFTGSILTKFRTIMLRNPTHDSWLLRQGAGGGRNRLTLRKHGQGLRISLWAISLPIAAGCICT